MSADVTRHRTGEDVAWRRLLAIAAIVGLLAAIAVPLYLDQGKKGHDSQTQSDLNAVAASIGAAANADQTEAPSLAVSGTVVTLNGETIATLSPGVVLGELQWVGPDEWCIDARDPDGKHAASPGYKFEGPDGDTKTGQCS
jgi:type II secretory pathway pseudopilin PulG